MSARKPKIEYYWTKRFTSPDVNWRLIAANGEVICQSSQGFRDKTDAQRSVRAVSALFANLFAAYGPFSGNDWTVPREVGPGRKPS